MEDFLIINSKLEDFQIIDYSSEDFLIIDYKLENLIEQLSEQEKKYIEKTYEKFQSKYYAFNDILLIKIPDDKKFELYNTFIEIFPDSLQDIFKYTSIATQSIYLITLIFNKYSDYINKNLLQDRDNSLLFQIVINVWNIEEDKIFEILKILFKLGISKDTKFIYSNFDDPLIKNILSRKYYKIYNKLNI